jgi:hypothetical protein
MGARGRPRSSYRQWVENCLAIDIAASRQSCRDAEYWDRPPQSIFLNKREYALQSFNVKLTSTRPNYGGIRYWFVCPRPGCGRRVAKLYISEDRICGCRRCLRLVYEVQYRRSAKYWMIAGVREMLRSHLDPGRSGKRLDKLIERAMRLNPVLCSPLSLKLLNFLLGVVFIFFFFVCVCF